MDGKKVAVLVESKYIPEEIEAYRTEFAALGAEVELVSRIWYGDHRPESNTFLSDVDPGDPDPFARPQTLTVSRDISTAKPSDYAAVVMSANYTSVRLRWSDALPPGEGPFDARAYVRESPVHRFFAEAMRDPGVVKGALCHGLWILAPEPELLRGRKVICHTVVMADVLNCGAQVVRTPDRVVADGDLVTGYSKHEVVPFIHTIAEQVAAVTNQRSGPMPKRKILVLLSEYGYWGEELVGPVEEFDRAGYEVVFATPRGKRPIAIPVSMDPGYIDPPLGRSVTSAEMAEKVRAFDDPSNPRLDNPIDLSSWFPEQPYWSAPDVLRKWESYYRGAADAAKRIAEYDALLVVGGSGPLVDLANNGRVHELIMSFTRAGKPVAAECYGVACLAFARDMNDRKSIIWGKHVTGHCKEYDYLDGTGVVKGRDANGNAEFYDLNMGPPPYPLEYILRDATGPEGGYHGNVGKETSVIVDYPFITGRSTPDSYLTGEKVVEVLEQGLRRYGW